MTSELNRVVVIGGSAGGMEAIQPITAVLEPGLPAAVVIVQHLSRGIGTSIASRLSKTGALDAVLAADGTPLEAGCIYVAPADQHLLVEHGRIRLTYGPRVNNVRPAIDLAFRSAAVAYPGRAIGVVVSGMLDDGAVGMRAIKRCGGYAVVQDPAEALYDEMPASTLASAPVDQVLPVGEIGGLLNTLCQHPGEPVADVPTDILLENRFDLNNCDDLSEIDQLGGRAPISCPDCGGPMWEIDAEGALHYRCHIGHSLNPLSLVAQQEHQIEEALWTALRALEEKARMQARLAEQGRDGGRATTHRGFEARHAETTAQAERIRNVLLSLGSTRQAAAA